MYTHSHRDRKRVQIVSFSRLPLTLSSLALTTTLITGCAVGPDFQRPDRPDASSYETTPAPGATASADSEHGDAQKLLTDRDIPHEWWGLFHSEPLNQLIKNALTANPDVAAAQAALRVAEENTAAETGQLFPTITGSFNSQRQKTSGNSNGGKFSGSIFNLHTATVSVGYGLDVFGGTRRQIEQSEAVEEYQRFELEATYLTLTSNLVASAIQEASLRGQIAATEKIIDDQSSQLNLIKQQFELGGVAKSAVLAQQTKLQQTKATLPPLKKQLAITRHQLSVLGGQLPNREPSAVFDLAHLKLPQEIPLSLPSRLVEQRPDIRAAEASLHAASAAIGVAVANRLPQFVLNADIGSVANKVGNLFTPGGGIWAMGLDASQTLFDAGTLMHKEHSAEAEYDMVAAQYRKTVLSAFQDVADTLHALQSDAETLSAQADAEKAAAESLALSRDQFNAGAVSYLDLLNAELAEQQAKIDLIKAEAQRFSDTAALFQALGGGWWNRPADPSAASVTAARTDTRGE